MGWWSDDIMGGDTPLDIEIFIYDALDVTQFPKNEDDEVLIPKDGFNYKKIVKYLKGRDSEDYYVTGEGFDIFHQVLGVMMMKSGAPINDTLKAKMIKAANNDEWANEGELGREDKMNAFINDLDNYDGTPKSTESEGLMDKIADVMVGTTDEAYKDLNKDLNADLNRRMGWLEKRITLTEPDKEYIALMMNEFAQYYYSRFKK